MYSLCVGELITAVSPPSADMSTVLSDVLMQACVRPTLLPSRFALEHMALVAALNVRVGSEVGEGQQEEGGGNRWPASPPGSCTPTTHTLVETCLLLDLQYVCTHWECTAKLLRL